MQQFTIPTDEEPVTPNTGKALLGVAQANPARAPAPSAYDAAAPADEEPPEYIKAIRELQSAQRRSGVFTHFFAMMRKNATQKLRSPVGSVLELVLPVFFVLGLVLIWKIAASDHVAGRDFVQSGGNQTDLLQQEAALATTLNDLLCYDDAPLHAVSPCGVSPGKYCFVDERLFPRVKGLCVRNRTEATAAMYGSFLAFHRPRVVPSLDAMVAAQWIFRGLEIDADRRPRYGTYARSLYNSGELHFAPDTPAVRALRDHLNQTSTVFRNAVGQVWPSQEAFVEYNRDGSHDTWGLVVLEEATAQALRLTLRFNRSGTPWTDQIINEGGKTGLGEYAGRQYVASGFMSVQHAVQRWYQTTVLDVAASPAPVVAPMPFSQYDDSEFLKTIGGLAPLFLVFGYLYAVSQLTKRMVEEKESRMREAMMIMGLGTGSFYSSWILTSALFTFVGSLLMAVIGQVTFLTNANFLLNFLLYFLFGQSTVTLAGLLASFFSKSRVAALVAPVLFFVMAIPSFALPASTPAAVLLPLSLLSPTAFSIGAKLLFQYEASEGLQFSNMGSSNDDVPFIVALIFLAADTVLYFFLALYLDAVLPNDWGTRKHPLFCFPCFGKSSHDGETGDGRDPKGAYEDHPRSGQPTVRIEGLRKVFDTPAGRMTAVNDLRFDLYEDEVTVLLGHNGAGKTTAMNLMTGMLEIDGGECSVYGHCVRNDLHAARQEIGYCPQHNILWDDLTCKEHLLFFASLKGFVGDDRDKAVDAMLAAVDLKDKAHVLSSGLSGGQKRKLSVAIAFVGGSRLVFLDEPTAGMDVAARRFTWDLIKQMSPGRTVVLTTHFMDEADLLGNTIAIMSKGRLKCMGSSLFLKSRLGVGYSLHIATAMDCEQRAIERLVRTHVPEADTLAAAAGEIAIRLPMHSVPAFPAMLRSLENDGPASGVRNHGISVTTLEEVFLKIGHDEHLDEDTTDTATELPETTRNSLVSPSTVQSPRDSAVAAIDKVGEGAGKPLLGDMAHSDAPPRWATANPDLPSPARQVLPLLLKRFHNAKRDRRTQVMQLLLPAVCILLAMLLTLIKFDTLPSLAMTGTEYNKGVEAVVTGCPAAYSTTALPDTTVTTLTPARDAVALSTYLMNTAKAHRENRLSAIRCGALTPTNATLAPTVLFNNESGYPHSMPLTMHTYSVMYTRDVTGDAAVSQEMQVDPLPLTAHEDKIFNSFQSLMIGIFIMIPFTFIPSTFVAFVVKERECHAKHLQTVSGMNYFVYWCSNFAFDFVCFVVTSMLAIIIFLIFDREEYVGSVSKFFATLVLMLMYGLSAVSGSYLLSFLFESHATAQNITMMANFIAGFMLVLIAYFLSIISSTKTVGEVLTYVFRVIPSFCLGNGIVNLASGGLFTTGTADFDPWHLKVTGWNMIYLAVEAPLFFALTLIIDHPSRRMRSQKLLGSHAEPEALLDEDPDVATERRDVETGARDTQDYVTVRNLRKVYDTQKGHKVAVKNLSFGVHKGEVFGFLGTNGAGKTTTMSVLVGEIMPTAGQGLIAGKDVVNDAAEVRQLLGYCPQFDAVLELLTPEEHLELYAGLRGLQGETKREVIEGLIHSCGLSDHRKKEARSLSGGNKRKLSVAISLIGGPQVVFLDEPSAGMDPMARRGLWDVIELVARHCSVVLTTHHLEEVEALATRVAIMVDGEMRCIGSLQHLKHKFGSGFEMSMRVRTQADVEAAQLFVRERIPAATLQECRNQKMTYALPGTTKLSAVFEDVEQHKDALRITDYSISQTTLETVFLRISEGAKANDDESDEADTAALRPAVAATSAPPKTVPSNLALDDL